MMAQQQEQKEEKQEQPEPMTINKSDEKEDIDSEELFQEMYELLPQEVVAKWYDFGLQLGFTFGELSKIEGDASQKATKQCALDMLKLWREQNETAATPEKLIAALKGIDQNRFAAQLKTAIDNEKFDKEYNDQQIATHIAPYWNDLGNRLRVKNLKGIKSINSPTQHKYKDMLETWINKHTGSKHDTALKLHEALIAIGLIAAAEKFKKVALNDSKDDKNNNDDGDDVDDGDDSDHETVEIN